MYRSIRAEKERSLFRQLFNSYVEELGQFDPQLLATADRFGDYLPEQFNEYFSSPMKRPYIIKSGRDAVGLVVFSRPGEGDEEDGCDIYIEELYIAKPYRRRGIATAVVEDYLAENVGRVCGLCVYKQNSQAMTFWEDFFAQRGIATERQDAGALWFYKAQI